MRLSHSAMAIAIITLSAIPVPALAYSTRVEQPSRLFRHYPDQGMWSGTIAVGDMVEVLECDRAPNYCRVRNELGHVGWAPSSALQYPRPEDRPNLSKHKPITH